MFLLLVQFIVPLIVLCVLATEMLRYGDRVTVFLFMFELFFGMSFAAHELS